MFRAIASPRAQRFVVAVHDYVLLYDAAALLPRMIDTPLANTTFHGFVGNAHYLMGYMLEDWQRFELATGKATSLGRVEFGTFVAAPPDGSYAIVRPRGAKSLLLLAPGKPPFELEDAVTAVAISDKRIVYATPTDVFGLDLGPNRHTKLWSSNLRRLAGNGAFVVAVSQTNLWRRDERTGAATTIDWTAGPAAFAVDPQGNAWIAVEASVWKWSVTDNVLARVGQVARPIKQLAFVAGTGCIAIDDRRGATIIVENQPPRSAAPTGYELHDLAHTAPLAAGLTQDRRVVVYDLDARHLWSLGAGEATPEISDDGTHIATFVGGQIAIYSLELPADRTAYEAWLDATTNLKLADPSATDLVWPK
jgi:hypothetical protein